MDNECLHCGHTFLPGEVRVEGREGTYCEGTCMYDAEVLGVEPEELPPKPPLRGWRTDA